jgi:DNA-binding transcriptional ArsR family regulator
MSSAYLPNVTQTPDILLDHWMAELSGAEFKVLMYLVRRTYGFRKPSDTVALSQLTDGIRRRDGSVVDRGTGLSKSTVCAALAQLEARGLVLRERRESEAHGTAATCYQLNLAAPDPPVQKSDRGVSENRTGPLSENRTQQQTTLLQQTTATTSPAAAPLDDHTDQALVTLLRDVGVSPGVATRLAAQLPEECARQLTYLPFVENLRSSPGAYLRAAIEGRYAPPPGWARAQDKQQQKERAEQQRRTRVARTEEASHARARNLALLDEARRDPARWTRLEEAARARLPLLLRERPEHIAYQPSLQAALIELLKTEVPSG